MSSYIIEKMEYVKAAGLIAGMTQNTSVGKVILQAMLKLWKWNCKSVIKQYGEAVGASANDQNDYPEEYDLGAAAGLHLAKRGGASKEYRQGAVNLGKFFASVLYQIEDKKLHGKAAAVIVDAMSTVYEDALGLRAPHSAWGHVTLEGLALGGEEAKP